MNNLHRWIMLAIIVLASIAVALDHSSYHRPKPAAEETTSGMDQTVETGGYGTVTEDTDDE